MIDDFTECIAVKFTVHCSVTFRPIIESSEKISNRFCYSDFVVERI